MIVIEPKVSILMTSFNRELFIGEAIESVLASAYGNFELIISDDASSDNTVIIAKQYEQSDNRVIVHVNEKNIGQFENRNKAIGYATGEFLMHVDSDDTIKPDGIARCVAAMMQFPEADFGMYSLLDEPGPPYFTDAHTAIRKHLFTGAFMGIGPGGTILKRDFVKSINGYTDKYGAAGDMYFNLKACIAGKGMVMLPFEFWNYRRHEGQEINNTFSYLYYSYAYFNDALKELRLPLNKKEIGWHNKKTNGVLF